ncbi:14059_t:CDS:10, partial [Cetraspora pellucida]
MSTSTSTSTAPINNIKNLAYNILKTFKDGIIKGKKITELGPCSECDNDILISPLKAFTYLACRHLFHRLCIEKKLLLTVPNTCPFLGCGKNVEILDQANPLGTVSNLPLTNPKEASQSTGISPLMGIEDTATQQVKSNLRCAKCSKDLSSYLLPIGFLWFSPQLQGPLKPLICLTCKHIIHYNCINNSQKLCPICPLTNMKPEEEEEMSVDNEEQPDTSSKKCSNEGTDINLSSPKKKAKKAVRRKDLPILKKLIKELSAPIPQQSSSGSIISLQTFPNMDISSVNFPELENKIINAEDSNKKTILEVIHAYYYFGKGLKQVSEANLRKRKERAIKIFKLFDRVGGEGKIYCIKSFSASTISRLGMNNIDYVKAKELEEAITTCRTNNSKNKRKLVEILSQFNMTSKEQHQKFYKEAWMKEKEKRQAMEQECNINIIQENIEFILSRCRVKLGNSCSEATIIAYIEIVHHLERLDLATIKPEVPLASGIIDLSGNEDPFVNLLSSRSKQILMHHEFGNNKFLGEIKFMMDDFVDTYKDLRPDFDPVISLIKSISNSRRHIWSLRPLLTEDDYSENLYVIYAVSKQTNKSSQSRMERMKATNSGKKPDLQVLLKLDTVENEIVLAEVSRLLPQQDKEIIDWKKLISRSINDKLEKVPVLGIQVIRDRLIISALDLFEDDFYRNALKMRFMVKKIIAMSVDVKDEISLLPVTENWTPSTSMIGSFEYYYHCSWGVIIIGLGGITIIGLGGITIIGLEGVTIIGLRGVTLVGLGGIIIIGLGGVITVGLRGITIISLGGITIVGLG